MKNNSTKKSKKKKPKTYPPYKKGYFKVSHGHKLYYEFYGNPNGVPVVYFHGGPGGGFHERNKAGFHKSLFNVLLFEQRGAGRSKPFASIKHNTTQLLIEDTLALINFAGFEKAILCGGSWGSTLALAFAIQHPERAHSMVLNSSFLGNKEGMDYYIQGGVQKFLPDVWQRFIDLVPKNKQKDPVDYYYKKMTGKNPKDRKKYAFEWSRYEMMIAPLHKPSEKKVQKVLDAIPFVSLGTLEAHYFKNKCFLPENHILKNLDKISHIPVHLIQGQYDLVCPPSHSFALHQGLPKSTLKFFVLGHFITGKEAKSYKKKKLEQEAKRWKKQFKN